MPDAIVIHHSHKQPCEHLGDTMPKRFLKAVERSEESAGKSPEEAERIAYATANKRGLLENKHGMKHRARKKSRRDHQGVA